MGTNITGIGNANAIGFKSRVTGGTYFPPELKDALVGVWSAYGKSNDSTDRNIIKNKIKDRGGDFVISNAAFKLNSGFGKYETELSNMRIWTQSKETTSSPFSSSYNGLSGWSVFANTGLTNSADMPSFKIQVKGLLEGQELIYRYYDSNGQSNVYSMGKDGEYTLPADIRTAKPQTSNTSGFQVVKNDTNTITITQIPSFVGAFVTDGIDDLITSTKTVQEMLGGSNEITVVSMIHQIGLGCRTNFICDKGSYWRCNEVANTGEGKTGIYGYSSTNISVNTPNIINNVLGDKVDYSVTGDRNDLTPSQFSVVGHISSSGKISYTSSVAWYWTVIANKVLTTDQINQVIAYFNLDRTLNPDILCNTIKQGITNENHEEFGDKLIDFSGNGRDIQLNNIAWKLDSGIGKYEVDFSTWSGSGIVIGNGVGFKIEKETISWWGMYAYGDTSGLGSFTIKVTNCHDPFVYRYKDEDGNWKNYLIESDGIYTLPASGAKDDKDNYRFFNSNPNATYNGLTVEQIPSHAGALCLDGVNDFGKVTGMPIYKDYTIIADYERFYLEPITGGRASILSKSSKVGDGSFIFNLEDQNGGKACYTFGEANGNISDDITRIIRYQSKYYNTKALSIGTAEDNDFMVLGKVREVDNRYFYGAIYSLMSFPYSMSEFLIERQLKKHKLGTLYPDMVEFRPVIKSNVLLDAKPTFVIRGTSTYLNAGDYVPENSQIWVSIKMNNIADRITKFTVNGKTIDIPENAYSEVTLQYGFPFVIDKSPQKITMTIEQDENYVQWNPTVESNVEYASINYLLRIPGQGTVTPVSGQYYPILSTDTSLVIYVATKGVDEVANLTVNGQEPTSSLIHVDGRFKFEFPFNNSPQKINITIDEYIRYEDIVQPYPVLLRFNDENGNEISWGGKFRVGSTITRIGSIADPESNLLNGLYSVSGLSLNGKAVTSSTSIVEKQMVFTCTATYLLDDNEPKCILSPSRLRIPNSSYKLLGYIPDISGHGNNGVFNNFAFAGMSGANGYPYDYNNSSFWADSSLAKVVSGELVEYFAVKNSTGFSNITSGVYKGKIKVTGVTKAISENKISRLRIYSNSTTDNELIDITQDGNYNIDIKGVDDANRVFFYAIPSNPNDTAVVRLTEPIYIEQVGNYEGSICFDGVDDYMDIPSLSIGGKQVLIKTNWLKSPTLLYDQRASGSFAILTTKEDDATNPRIAYQARNHDGKTYIDGIENNYIETYSLKGITHNITVTNPSAGSGVVPVIGANTGKSGSFAKMALYDFMLFDEVSTNEEIKQLNDIVGIEGGYVQKPPYYWDAYGKTNSDADRDTIQQRGVAVGNYDLTNYNHAYDKMSGYGGYSLGRFDKSWSSSNNTSVIVVSRNPYDITLKKLGGNSDWEFNNTELKVISNPVSVKFKSNKNIRVTCDYHYYPVGGNSEGTPLGITSKDLIANKDAIITISPISQENIDKYNIDVNRGYYLIYFQLSSTLAVNEEVTIEMLPLYPNGLVYDGVDDYSENASIPLLSDYTYIFKRTLLNKKYNSASIFKGSNKQSGGGAFICDYNSVEPDLLTQGFSFGAGLYVDSLNADSIVYGTRGSVNGTKITAGNNTDTEGLTVGKWRAYKEMVFYKLFLYPRTVNMLSINMVKNMMEEDGIIDLTSKLFTDKYTGDFYEMDFNNDFLIGN